MDLYKELGVNKDANIDEIKKAYRKQAKANHPDKHGDEEKMQSINKAYAILKNPFKRERYDRFGEEETVNNDDAKLTQIICDIVASLILKNPDDIKVFLQGLKREWNSTYNSGIIKVKQEKQSLENFKKRILKHPDNDIINNFIDGKINNLELQIINIEKDYEIRLKALGILLDDYVYKIKAEDPWVVNARQMGYTIIEGFE